MTNKDSAKDMWSYWSGKKGLVVALEIYYPQTAKNDPVISYALTQMEASRLAILSRMEELEFS